MGKMLICPKCSQPLEKAGSAFHCAQGHSYDIASSGYCNLLLSSKAGEFRGDNREMVAARREFLDTGAYAPLRDKICGKVLSLAKDGVTLLDSGCGEGYYTRAVSEALGNSGLQFESVGVDISKSATLYASKRDKLTQYITAGCFHLPVADKSVDILLSLFAPVAGEEFGRVLKEDGTVITVVPGEKHLWELKEAIYDNPYINDENKHSIEGFVKSGEEKLTYTAHLSCAEHIRALFSMTPYAHRTPAEGIERLNSLDSIDLTLSFKILEYKKQR